MRLIAGLALLALLLASCTPSGAGLPNFVVLLCDNLGYGDTTPFGSPVHRTPSLERMAAEGRLLTHFYASAGVCTPSRASLLTGCYAQRVGLHTNPRDGHVLRPVSPYGLHPDETTLAEILRARGYATAIVGKWHLGDQEEFLPIRHGFDQFFGVPYSDDMTRERGRGRVALDGDRWPPLPLMADEAVIEAPVDRNLLTRRYTERALEFIDANLQRPFFLLLAHAMPGSEQVPFASEAFRDTSRNGRWGDAVEELDWSTGAILDRLVETGLDRRTLVLWTSDNGAPLAADPASLTRGSNRPLHGRGYTTAEGAFRVPAIAWWPGVVPSGTQSDELMSTIDLLPSLAALAGTAPPPDQEIDGLDIREALLGEGAGRSPRETLYFYQEDELQAVRKGRWKLFLPLEHAGPRHPHFEKGVVRKALLFDVAGDPGASMDRADEFPEVVRDLMLLAEQARATLGDRGRAGSGQRPPGWVERTHPRVLPR